MKRPSFQFYPADWQGNPNLKRCTREEKSIWLDIMFILHDQDDEYGLVRWPLAELANAVGEPLRKLRSLVSKGVLKGADAGETCTAFVYTPRSGRKDGDPVTLIPEQPGPIWYSSRMVRDEYVRKVRGENSRFTNAQTGEVDGEEILSPNTSPITTPKGSPKVYKGDGSSTSSSSSSSEDTSLRSVVRAPELELTAPKPKAKSGEPPGFAEFYAKYPRHEARADAAKAFADALKRAPVDRIMAGLERYVAAMAGKERQYVKLPAGWLRSERWLDETSTAAEPVIAAVIAPALSAEDRWRRKLQLYVEKRHWIGPDGAPPLDRDGNPHPDCCVPRALLAEFGLLTKPIPANAQQKAAAA